MNCFNINITFIKAVLLKDRIVVFINIIIVVVDVICVFEIGTVNHRH